MQVLNLVREFEMQRVKELETIKEYADKLLSIVNKVRFLGSEFSDSRIVQKTLVTVSERFEATTSSLENTKDLSRITLAELLNALQAQEERRLMRVEGSVEGVLQAKLQINLGEKGKKKKTAKRKIPVQKKQQLTPATAMEKKTKNFLLANIVAKRVILLSSVGEDLMSSVISATSWGIMRESAKVIFSKRMRLKLQISRRRKSSCL